MEVLGEDVGALPRVIRSQQLPGGLWSEYWSQQLV